MEWTQSGNSVQLLFCGGAGQFSKSSTESLTITSPDEILVLDSLFDSIVVGLDLEALLGTEEPVDGISVEARDLLGVVDGTVLYPGSGGASTSVTGPLLF